MWIGMVCFRTIWKTTSFVVFFLVLYIEEMKGPVLNGKYRLEFGLKTSVSVRCRWCSCDNFFLLNTSTTFVGPYSKVDGMLTIFNFLHRNQELYNMSQSYEINEASNIVLFGLNT